MTLFDNFQKSAGLIQELLREMRLYANFSISPKNPNKPNDIHIFLMEREEMDRLRSTPFQEQKTESESPSQEFFNNITKYQKRIAILFEESGCRAGSIAILEEFSNQYPYIDMAVMCPHIIHNRKEGKEEDKNSFVIPSNINIEKLKPLFDQVVIEERIKEIEDQKQRHMRNMEAMELDFRHKQSLNRTPFDEIAMQEYEGIINPKQDNSLIAVILNVQPEKPTFDKKRAMLWSLEQASRMKEFQMDYQFKTFQRNSLFEQTDIIYKAFFVDAFLEIQL